MATFRIIGFAVALPGDERLTQALAADFLTWRGYSLYQSLSECT
jgi:hypothetical protein